MGETITILSTMTGLLLITHHPCHHADLVIEDLLDVLLVVVKVFAMASQPNVLTVELLLDHVVPFPQTIHQLLIVGDKELDVLPVLARLLFEMICLNVLVLAKLNCPSFTNTYPLSFILVHRPQSH